MTTAKYKLSGTPDTPYTLMGGTINQTVEATEAAISALGAGSPVIAFPSGMAAITAALMVTFSRLAIAFWSPQMAIMGRGMLLAEFFLSAHDMSLLTRVPTKYIV